MMTEQKIMCSIEKDQKFDAEISRIESEERFVSTEINNRIVATLIDILL
jgi:hypothetical protein